MADGMRRIIRGACVGFGTLSAVSALIQTGHPTPMYDLVLAISASVLFALATILEPES